MRGATEAINLVAKSWGWQNVDKDDEIVITWLEHHANIVPWHACRRRARSCGGSGGRHGQMRLDEYEQLLGPRTKLVSSAGFQCPRNHHPGGTNVRMAHRYGAQVLIDGAQAVSHMRVNVQELDGDFYVFSGHKVFAPTGIGVVYGKADLLTKLPPWQGGGNMITDVTFERTTYHWRPADSKPERAASPTPSDWARRSTTSSKIGLEKTRSRAWQIASATTPLPDNSGLAHYRSGGPKSRSAFLRPQRVSHRGYRRGAQ